jgi:predicted TIM-barrel fold metal-dependent hydrolase
MPVPFPTFDADNHYYEATDAFTRYLAPAMRKRCMQWAEIEGKQRLLVAGRINRYIPNPTFDPVSKPGTLVEYFRAKEAVTDMRAAFGVLEPIASRPEYRDREKRLELMDKQNIEACFMLPTLGVGMESALEDDPEAFTAAFTAFNRWLNEDWGFSYKNRIFAAPYVSLADPDWAIRELDYAISQNARVVLMRCGPPAPRKEYLSLGHPLHEPFWKRLNESGLALVFHGSEASYKDYEKLWGLTDDSEVFKMPLLKRLLSASAIRDTIASLFADGVLDRHANIRVATIETGADWVEPLLKKLKSANIMAAGEFASDPVKLFKERIWVTPFFEDDVKALVETLGPDHVLFGSDFPHAEGLPEPTDFVEECRDLSETDIRKIMRENAWSLATPRPLVGKEPH